MRDQLWLLDYGTLIAIIFRFLIINVAGKRCDESYHRINRSIFIFKTNWPEFLITRKQEKAVF
jgi:hypothetical protein